MVIPEAKDVMPSAYFLQQINTPTIIFWVRIGIMIIALAMILMYLYAMHKSKKEKQEERR